MARWVLTCPECKQEFTHSQVEEAQEPGPALLDPFAWIAGKPVFPETGISFTCPHCKAEKIFRRHELVYRN